MKNKNIFYKQVDFYLTACVLIISIVALSLYAGNCASEFNGGAVSSSVILGDVLAIVFSSLAIIGSLVGYFMPDNRWVSEAIKYKRFCLFVAFLALIYSFLMGILDEYSLLGTILYPIVSGTVGDPVEPTLLVSYFAQLICTFVSLIMALVTGIVLKASHYKAEKNTKQEPTKERIMEGK